MAFNVQYLGELERVQRVEAHVSTWQANGSAVFGWSVHAYPTQDRSARVLVDTGAGLQVPAVEELYEPDMEAGQTQAIFDGTTVYELMLFGQGRCSATLVIKGELAGSTSGLVELKSATASLDAFVPAKKRRDPDIPLPAADTAAAEIYFQQVRRRRSVA